MKTDDLAKLVTTVLDDHKALQITDLDVTALTDLADHMIICSATSKRHAGGLADKLIHRIKEAGVCPLGVEGEAEAEWILIDLCDVVVHIMLPEVRDFYSLEKLWSMTEASRKQYEN